MKQKVFPAQKYRSHVADGLAHLLADTYVLYLKTQNFHWNVRGPHFAEYHKLFEAQYEQLATATDLIAERLRALNVLAPASFSQFLMLTSLKEADGNKSAEAMIQELLHDHELMGAQFGKLFEWAQKEKDEVTLDLFIQRKTEHDKIAWMLRSLLE